MVEIIITGFMPFQNYHSARMINPDVFKEKYTINITDGVTAIIGIRDGKKTSEVQAYRFDRKKFSPSQMKEWLKKNKKKPISIEEAKGD